MLINVLLDVAYFRDLVDVSVYPAYFNLLETYVSLRLSDNPQYDGLSPVE